MARAHDLTAFVSVPRAVTEQATARLTRRFQAATGMVLLVFVPVVLIFARRITTAATGSPSEPDGLPWVSFGGDRYLGARRSGTGCVQRNDARARGRATESPEV